MITERIQLFPDKPHVYLDFYGNELAVAPNDAMLVIPGGGYSAVCSDREGDPIALNYLNESFNCFVLHYSVGPQIGQPTDPLYEAATAMLYIKQNAAKYGVDPERVFTVGFSAGGHLAASLGIIWDDPELQARLGGPGEAIRPRGLVLCYAVISSQDYGHLRSFKCLLGSDEPDAAQLKRFSLEEHVRGNSAPAFIMHTFADKTVPVNNALQLAAAYWRAGLLCEMHIYPNGSHGIALATELTARGRADQIDPQTARWLKDSAIWARKL